MIRYLSFRVKSAAGIEHYDTCSTTDRFSTVTRIREAKMTELGHGVEKQAGLPPGSIDFVPFHLCNMNKLKSSRDDVARTYSEVARVYVANTELEHLGGVPA